MRSHVASDLAQRLMYEVRAAAASDGADVPESFSEKMLRDTRKMVPYASSMLLDYRAKRPLEIQAIVGNPLSVATKNGVPTPTIQAVFDQLRFLDRRNCDPEPA